MIVFGLAFLTCSLLVIHLLTDSTVVWKERTVDAFYEEFKVDTLKN